MKKNVDRIRSFIEAHLEDASEDCYIKLCNAVLKDLEELEEYLNEPLI